MDELKSAFVTGGSRGIGKAVVEALTNLGIQVVAPSRAELDLANLKNVYFCTSFNRYARVYFNLSCNICAV